MGGFMPLIEGFLAFALTMLALATAVSAIVGVWLRFFRWRAFGFRQSMVAIYDGQIEPRLTEARVLHPSPKDRLDFIADMTFSLNVQAGMVSLDVRERRVSELEYCLSQPKAVRWYGKAGRFLQLRFRSWRSLRYGVDHMADSQFQLRLDASKAGKTLAAYYGAEEWLRVKALMTQTFTEVGAVATEGFARRARVRTVIAGLLLAVAVNIDSFDLLNTYLTDDEIRRSVLAQQEKILQQQVPALNDPQAADLSLDDYAEKADKTIEQIQQSISGIGASQNLSSADKQTLEQLQMALETVREDVATVTQATEELEHAISKTSGIAASLTKSFPIGWDGYPNCDTATSDLRCARLKNRLTISFDDASKLGDVLMEVAVVDTSGFIKWLIGVLLTGFMAGLGAPFWVQTVDRLLKLKSHVKGTEDNEPAQDSESATASTQSSANLRPAPIVPGGREGLVARTSADQAPDSTSAPASVPAVGHRARSSADDASDNVSLKN